VNSITYLVYINTTPTQHNLPSFLSLSTTPQQPHTMEIQVHKEHKEEHLHLTTPPNHTIEAQVHNKEQEEAPLLLTIPLPHTIEVQARKDEEEALILQTCALKIDEKEEDSPKLEKEVHMKESYSPPPSPPPPPPLHEVEVIPHTMEAQFHKEETLIIHTCALKIDDKEEEHSPKQQKEVHMKENDSPPPPPPPPLHEVEVIPHTMEAHVHKEEALIIQTCAPKIDDKEEQHSPKQGQEEVHMKENENEADAKENDSPPPLHEVEAILEYEFKNKLLLEEAFTHGTYGAENGLSYERLEYIGDSVLNLMITKEQFHAYPTLAPGHLTRLRAANVDAEKLARVAIKHGLHSYLRHKKPLLGDQVSSLSHIGYFVKLFLLVEKETIFTWRTISN